MNRPFLAALFLPSAAAAGLVVVSCGSPPYAEAAGTPATAEAQVDRGGAVFAQRCAECHGDSGQGTEDAPRLVGLAQGALPLDPPPERRVRKTQFKTAMDVAQFVVANMPPGKRQKLSEPDAWAVLAFALTANGVELREPVGAHNASAIKLH